MINAKRVIKATSEILERQYLKLLFVQDDLQKELEDLPAGKTIGESGAETATRLCAVMSANNYVSRALKACSEALETYEKKGRG